MERHHRTRRTGLAAVGAGGPFAATLRFYQSGIQLSVWHGLSHQHLCHLVCIYAIVEQRQFLYKLPPAAHAHVGQPVEFPHGSRRG